jgi:hypothetical protein
MSSRSQVVSTLVEAIQKKKLHVGTIYEGPKHSMFHVSTSAWPTKFGLDPEWEAPMAAVMVADTGTIDVEPEALRDLDDQKLAGRVRKIVESVVR